MICGFANQGTEDIYNGLNTGGARRVCSRVLWSVAFRKLDQIESATELNDLAVPPGNRLETPRGDGVGQQSIRINNQYRICFPWG